ncbi:MAG: PSD1 domain-containing protein [Verrucomicrobia bacterium]|nr:PSD1 domain-containing protein [Verrucomicrobiota bacterium]
MGFGIVFTIAALRAEAAAPAKVDFARDIQPIFIKRCYECHGPDQQKNKLRLDVKADAFRGGKSGLPAIVPGKSSESEILKRVTSDDPDEVMPSKGERLTPEQIAALRAWMDQGAEWPEQKPHWAFVKPSRSSVPAVKSARWPGNEIDRIILARLEQEGLSPSPEADRATLIRRVCLDLTGLPPTLAEVDAFLKDRSKDAYEKLVDRLLDSPHYGEHFARMWLDLARYADSNGYQVDLARSIWPYREWVINAFNRNQPFDQFTIEQLAGDVLPNATLEQKIATGFSRNTKINDEGGGDEEEYRTKAVKDRVATTATTWLGLTMMCAECHTHKYDPITQEDYYRFYAFFNSTADRGNYSGDPAVAVPAPPVQHKVAYLRSRLAQVKAELAAAEKNLPAEQQAWERRLAGKASVWTTLALTNAVSTGGSSFTNLPDQSILATGVSPIYDTMTVEAETDLTGITAVLLEVLPDPSLPKNGPGRWGQTGNFILDEFALSAAPKAEASANPASLFFSHAQADWEQQYYRAEHAVDRNPKTGWAIGPRFGERHFLIAALKEPAGFAGGTKLGFRFEHYHGNSHTIGRMRLSVTNERDPDALWPLPPGITTLLAVPAGQRTPDQRQQLAAHYRTVSPAIRRLEREIFRLNQREADLANARYTTLVMQELAQPRETHIHVRGNFLEKGKLVTPGVPAFLPQLPASPPPNRLALARWLVDPENPLTARVTVNRLWERFFGTGLVKTSEDLGKQGEPPSHPELLDWLACEFVTPSVPVNPFNRLTVKSAEGGHDSTIQRFNDSTVHPWDIKHIVRLIVTSTTYRQSAAATDELLAKDLYNRLLARGPRFRLDAETIRDNALAISGLLNDEIGGPSAYPLQVPNLWKEIGFLRPEIGMDEWPVSTGPDLYRRALYTFWRRVCTYPTFATFDAPSRDVCVSRRPRTNTPLQALAGLNETTLLEAARVFAQRILRDGGPDPARQIDFAFRLCTARPPTKAERQRLVAFYEQQVQGFARAPQEAETLLAVGAAERPPDVDVCKLAAWMMVANVLLNLDETITKG